MIVLDTHVALWLTGQKSLLSPAAAAAIRDASRAGDGVAIASSSLWELAMMSVEKEILLPAPLPEYLRYVEKMFVVLPITGAIAERSVKFTSSFPRDPNDRMIAATALVHGSKLVTGDGKIRESGEVNCVW